MAITDKTRKLLWGRSGNRCAICKRELILDATSKDDPSIAGDECHIISGQSNGPRYNKNFPTDKIDLHDNLILLCKVHHKIIDDQCETYTVDILKQMKINHEKWVKEKLSKNTTSKPIKIKRVKENIPQYLTRILTGRELMELIDCACAFSFDYDEIESKEEVELISNFTQMVQDLMDLSADLDIGKKIEVSFEMENEMRNIEKAGYFIFAARENQILEGGTAEPSSWPVVIVKILRKTNKSIISKLEDLK